MCPLYPQKRTWLVESLQTKLQTNRGHVPIPAVTGQDDRYRNSQQKCTLSHCAARSSRRILELENRGTGNRTVGSNPTLSDL